MVDFHEDLASGLYNSFQASKIIKAFLYAFVKFFASVVCNLYDRYLRFFHLTVELFIKTSDAIKQLKLYQQVDKMTNLFSFNLCILHKGGRNYQLDAVMKIACVYEFFIISFHILFLHNRIKR